MSTMSRAGEYGGHLTYLPRFALPDHQALELRDLLVERTHVEEPENGTFPIDWFCNNADGPPYHTREGVLLYRDGGDSEDAAVLFFGTSGRVHVPPLERQAELAGASGDLWDLWASGERSAHSLSVLNTYLDSVLNDPAQWEPFEFTNEYAGIE